MKRRSESESSMSLDIVAVKKTGWLGSMAATARRIACPSPARGLLLRTTRKSADASAPPER